MGLTSARRSLYHNLKQPVVVRGCSITSFLPGDWQKSTLLEEEKAATRFLASIAASRRELSMVKIENPTRFKFDTPEGEKSLTDLFDGRNQLIIYHFMNKAAGDTTFVAVATAPLEKTIPVKERMEWKFPLYSSVEAWKQAEVAGEVITWKPGNGYLGQVSAFLKDGNDMHHTYSTTDRGLEMILSTCRLFDMMHLGCQQSSKLKHNCTKSKAAEFRVEGETEDARDKKVLPPSKKKAKLDKEEEIYDEAKLFNDPEAVKVREWRHKIQKCFFSSKGLPKDGEMPMLDTIFTVVENYDKMNIQYLSFSKIAKVMRHVTALPEDKVPRDSEFKFRERAQALVDKWYQILNANRSNSAEAVTINGMEKLCLHDQ